MTSILTSGSGAQTQQRIWLSWKSLYFCNLAGLFVKATTTLQTSVMNNPITKFAARVGRRSGDSRGKPPESDVVNDATADQDGDHDNENGETNPDHEVSGQQQECMQCNKIWDAIKSKTVVIQCSFCDLWTCASCAKFKKSNLTVMSRNDVLWSCHSRMHSMKKQTRRIQGTYELQEQITELKQTLENKIEIVIQNSVPKAVEKFLDTMQKGVSESVNANVNKLWSETLGDPTDVPALDSEEAKLALKKQTK